MSASRLPRDGGSDFITRWSRRKHQAGQDPGQDPEKTTDSDGKAMDNGNSSVQSADRQAPAARRLTDADMPDIDSLTPESSYAEFMSPGVSEGLRKLALRKLFGSEIFNIRDGLDEYDDDFTQFEKLGDIVTADMRHQVEMEARRTAREMLDDEDQAVDTASGDALEHNTVETDEQPVAGSVEAADYPDDEQALAEATLPAGTSTARKQAATLAKEAGNDDD